MFPIVGLRRGPVGSTKLTFPLTHALSGNVLYAVGSENFAEVKSNRTNIRTFLWRGIRYHLAQVKTLIASLVDTKTAIRTNANEHRNDLWHSILVGSKAWARQAGSESHSNSLMGIMFTHLAFIVCRRWYRGRYFRRLNERTLAICKQRNEILTGKIPPPSHGV